MTDITAFEAWFRGVYGKPTSFYSSMPNVCTHTTGDVFDAWHARDAEIESLRAELAECHAALELISAPQRPDGTWNRDREACRQVAQAALAAKGEK